MENSATIHDLISEIESTKANLYKLVQEKEWNLLDKEVVKFSQLLDELLLEYYHLKK